MVDQHETLVRFGLKAQLPLTESYLRDHIVPAARRLNLLGSAKSVGKDAPRMSWLRVCCRRARDADQRLTIAISIFDVLFYCGFGLVEPSDASLFPSHLQLCRITQKVQQRGFTIRPLDKFSSLACVAIQPTLPLAVANQVQLPIPSPLIRIGHYCFDCVIKQSSCVRRAPFALGHFGGYNRIIQVELNRIVNSQDGGFRIFERPRLDLLSSFLKQSRIAPFQHLARGKN